VPLGLPQPEIQGDGMTRRIEDIRNLGPAMARWLREIDVETEDDLREIGAAAAWHRLRFVSGGRVSVIALYAMEAAILGCDWRALPATRKAELKAETMNKEPSRRQPVPPKSRRMFG
jgi:DNA transformation protein and related proteins